MQLDMTGSKLKDKQVRLDLKYQVYTEEFEAYCELAKEITNLKKEMEKQKVEHDAMQLKLYMEILSLRQKYRD